MLQVGVDHRHERRGAGQGALDHRASEPAATDPAQALDPRLGERQRLHRLGGAVGEIVVDDDDAPVAARQRLGDPGDLRADVVPFVERRDDDGDRARLRATRRRVREAGDNGRHRRSLSTRLRRASIIGVS